MAEEADSALEFEGEQTAAPEDGEQGGEEIRPQTSPEIEGLARELGWVPETDWRGDKSRWAPPEDFIRGKAAKGDRVLDELREVKDQTSRILKANAKAAAEAIAKAKAEAQEQFHRAVEAGDVQAAEQARRDLAAVETEAPAANQDPAVADFAARNPWFNADEEATTYAISVAEREARKGSSPAQQTKAAEEAVKKRFPELFEAEAPRERGKNPPAVNAPQSRTARPAPRAKGVADLPPEALRAAREFEKKGLSLEAYAKTYWEEEAQ